MGDAPLSPARIRERLESTVFGRRLYYLPEVDSSNRIAKTLARQGERHGTVVITDYQTAGRGRRERTWTSPPMRNLLFSLILRPQRPAAEVLPLTLAFSLDVADVLAARCGHAVGVKWPNDVVAQEGKLSGILSESSTRAGDTTFVVVGIGVNVNMRPEDFPREMPQGGASCFMLTGSEHDRTGLLSELLAALENGYQRFIADGFAASVERYTQRCVTIDREVRFGGGVRGRAIAVRDDGGLVVAQPGGGEVVIYDVDAES